MGSSLAAEATIGGISGLSEIASDRVVGRIRRSTTYGNADTASVRAQPAANTIEMAPTEPENGFNLQYSNGRIRGITAERPSNAVGHSTPASSSSRTAALLHSDSTATRPESIPAVTSVPTLVSPSPVPPHPSLSLRELLHQSQATLLTAEPNGYMEWIVEKV
jgi:hypothetical protein